MSLNLNEVAAFLGLNPDTIRYYVREGLIDPAKNADNNYREFSSEDVLKISDIIFYRYMGLSISTIKKIFGGIPAEDIGDVIEESERDLLEKIKEYTLALEELQNWKKQYREELTRLGTYSIGIKPQCMRVKGYFNNEDHLVTYLKEEMNIEKEDWGDVSVSFLVDLEEDPLAMHKYISLHCTTSNMMNNRSKDVITEPEECCLITYGRMSDDPHEMVDPLVQYAKENGIQLQGKVYGIERTNYYVEGRRKWVCAIYAPLKYPERYKDPDLL
ncbi:MAG: MerR family transcriptional regulator [Clostridia bacterium]|nr:MerR family transcriptional regulator [Clostridia bacterium]